LTSRTISVPIQDGAPSRYSFQAVVIECSAAYAPKLREWFYELDRPTPKSKLYPYIGLYQFVPCLKSKDWPIEKIYRLAQLHVAILEVLKPIHITNIPFVFVLACNQHYTLTNLILYPLALIDVCF